MTVLLFNPPKFENMHVQRAYRCETRANSPLLQEFLPTIASYLKKNNEDVGVLDAAVLNLSYSDISKKIREIRPNIIVSLAANYCIDHDLRIGRIAKAIDKKIKVFVYENVLCSAFPGRFLKKYQIDGIIRGDPEPTILELARGIDFSKIHGLCYIKDGKIKINQMRKEFDLNKIPMPAFDEFPIKKYKIVGIRSARSCPFKCTFCSIGGDIKERGYGKIRFRSPTLVAKEIEQLNKKYGFKYFTFWDETFTVNKKHALEICKEIKLIKLGVEWGCQTRIDCLDEELIKNMSKAGCRDIAVGIETLNKTVMKNINKVYDISKIKLVTELCNKYDVRLGIYLIFGFLGDNASGLRDTIQVLKDLKIKYIQLGIATPIPGTKFYKDVEQYGRFLVNTNKLERVELGEYMLFRTPELNPKNVYNSLKEAYRSLFFYYLFYALPDAIKEGKIAQFAYHRLLDILYLSGLIKTHGHQGYKFGICRF